jgi:hypothetical protein
VLNKRNNSKGDFGLLFLFYPDTSDSYSKISNSFLYPNPLTNAIIYSKTDIDDLSIYNQVGERVEQLEKLQGNEPYQAQKLSPGIYTAIFKVNGDVVVQKLIMQ